MSSLVHLGRSGGIVGRFFRDLGLFALLLAFSSAVAAAGPCAAFGLTTSPITKLASTVGYKEGFASDGAHIVYDAVASEGDKCGQIGIYDLSTRTETLVSNGATNPDVSGNTIVYAKESAGGDSFSIYGYDLSTRTEFLVVAADPPYGGLQQPRIDGHIVVYSGYDSDGNDIGVQGVDLSTGATFTVSDDPNAYAPDVSNGWVVYCVLRPGLVAGHLEDAVQGDIMAYDIATRTTYTLCDNKYDQRNPRIGSSGIVVWDDERNAPSTQAEWAHTGTDVYGCSVYSRTNFAVAKGRGIQSQASVDGNLIVYYDSAAPGGYGVMGYDLLSGTRFGLAPTSKTGIISGAGLSGGMIVWGQTRPPSVGSGGYVTDLYMMQPAQLDVAEGSDVYTNAAAASQEAFPDGAASVVIASSQSWTDDLASASLVGTDTPLLLTARDVLPDVTAAEIRRLGATSATILGATDSISAAVQTQIQSIIDENIAKHPVGFITMSALSNPVARISGNSYAIADSIAAQVAARPGWNGTVIVVSGAAPADAMSVVPLVSAKGIPLILASPHGLSAQEITLLRSLRTKRAVIVGGTKVVPAHVASQLASVVGARNVKRLSGKDQYATAALVAAYGVSNCGLKWNGLGLASSASIANILTGGLAKARVRSVVLLTSGSKLSASASSTLKTHWKAIRKASYLGTTRLVSKSVRAQVRVILR
jgi:hypothetical protein